MPQKRQIIYVDASGHSDNSFHISLYDPETNASQVIKLTGASNSHEAEKLAVINAIIYIAKHNLSKAIICCDNENVALDNQLKIYASKLNSRIIWVPREINKVADKIAKLEPTITEKDKNLLLNFSKLLFSD